MDHLYGEDYLNAMHVAARDVEPIEVDRMRVKPIVKITGEFWAQTHRRRRQLPHVRFPGARRRPGLVEPIGTWVAYLMYQASAHAEAKEGLDAPYPDARRWEVKKKLANESEFRKKWLLLWLAKASGTASIAHHRAPGTAHAPSGSTE